MDDEQCLSKETKVQTSSQCEMPKNTVGELMSVEDPKNWPLSKKVYINTVLMMIVFLQTYASGVYSPGISAMLHDINMSKELAHLGTGIYMFGISVGSLLWGPMSQTVGRRPVFIVSLLGTILFSVGASLSMHAAGIIICRFFAGTMGATAFSNVAGSIVDMTTERERNPYNTMFRFFTFMGPAVAATVGAVVVHDSNWHWNLRSLPVAAFACLVLYTWTVPETYLPILIEQQIETEIENVEEQLHHHSWFHRKVSHIYHHLPGLKLVKLLLWRVIVSLPVPWILLIEEPLIMVITFYTSLLYGLLYGFLLIFPQVWGTVRGFSPVQVGYTYFAVMAGFCLSTAFVSLWIQNTEYRRAYDMNKHSPELRIRSGLFSTFLVPIGLFLFGWTAPFPHVHWIVPCIGAMCFSMGMLCVFSSWMAYMTDTYSNNTAAVIAMNSFVRCGLAGAFPLFTEQMVTGMTLQGAMTLFGGISIPLSGAGLVIAFYGNRIREKSRHAVYG